jgi:hypothetical protein
MVSLLCIRCDIDFCIYCRPLSVLYLLLLKVTERRVRVATGSGCGLLTGSSDGGFSGFLHSVQPVPGYHLMLG